MAKPLLRVGYRERLVHGEFSLVYTTECISKLPKSIARTFMFSVV